MTFQSSWQGAFNQVRLDAITGGAQPTTFGYDSFGRMVRLQWPDPARGIVAEHAFGMTSAASTATT